MRRNRVEEVNLLVRQLQALARIRSIRKSTKSRANTARSRVERNQILDHVRLLVVVDPVRQIAEIVVRWIRSLL